MSDEPALQASVAKALTTLKPQKSNTWVDQVRKDVVPEANGKSKGKGQAAHGLRALRFAANIKPVEWTSEPKLTTMSKMEQALSEDSDPPANLIIIIHGS